MKTSHTSGVVRVSVESGFSRTSIQFPEPSVPAERLLFRTALELEREPFRRATFNGAVSNALVPPDSSRPDFHTRRGHRRLVGVRFRPERTVSPLHGGTGRTPRHRPAAR